MASHECMNNGNESSVAMLALHCCQTHNNTGWHTVEYASGGDMAMKETSQVYMLATKSDIIRGIFHWDMASSQSATLGYLQTAKTNLHGGSTCHYPDILAGALSTVNLCPIVFAVIIISA